MYDDYNDLLDIDLPDSAYEVPEAKRPELNVSVVNSAEPDGIMPDTRQESVSTRRFSDGADVSAPAIENLDGTDVNDEQENREREAAVIRHTYEEQKKALSYNEPQSVSDTDPFGAYGEIEKGRKAVKQIAIVITVISALGFVFSAFRGRSIPAFASLMRIAFTYFMFRGRNWGRIVVLVSLGASIYSDLLLLFADMSASGSMQAFYLVMLIFHLVTGLVLWKNSSIKAYFDR